MEVSVPARQVTQTDLVRFSRTVALRCASHMNAQDREDVASDMLVDAVAAAYQRGAPVMALAIRASRRPRYYTRASHRAAESMEALVASAGEGELTPEDGPAGLEAVAGLTDVQGEQAVLDLVQRLPADERVVVRLCGLRGYTVREASAHLGVAQSTVHDRLLRARDRLRHASAKADAA